MELAVSNIAWTNDEEREVAERLQELGVKYVEVAPTKQWDDPTKALDQEIADYKAFWQSYGIEIVAFQSMLFSRPDLKIFENDENRARTQQYLQDFIVLAGKMGAQVMVFGSPKNRQRGNLPAAEANAIANDFFSTIGDTAMQNDVYFCIEPNPADYACDFVTNAQQGIDLVRSVGNDGFGLHLDIAGMTLAGDDVAASIKAAAPLLRHFHISSPLLEQVEEREDVHHREAAAALKEIGYDRFVSIEMRPAAIGENAARVEKAVRFAQNVYSS
jgi:D-psicose/D-tagatose/L-ribulose 3-epimerase